MPCPKIGLHNCKQNGKIFKDLQEQMAEPVQ